MKLLSSNLIGSLILAAVFALQPNLYAQKATTESLVGSDPKGDVVHWRDGAVWKQVTVKAVGVVGEGATQKARLEITNVPPGIKAGLFTNFVSVTMRGEDDALPPLEKVISATKLYTQGYAPDGVKTLPPTKAYFSDVYLCPWQTAWDARTVMPEYSLKGRQENKPVFLQMDIVITHVSVQQGQLYCLVRRSKTNKTINEGWYSDIGSVIFDRGSPQR